MESQAALLERAKRYDEAETDYKSLTGNPQLGGLYIGAYGSFLERRGRAKDAAALYADALKRAPGDRDLKLQLARASAGKRAPPMLSLKQGAARALTAAAELALVDKQINEGEVYLRLALKLDPAYDRGPGSIWATSAPAPASPARPATPTPTSRPPPPSGPRRANASSPAIRPKATTRPR